MLTTFNDESKQWVFVKNNKDPEIPVAQVLDFIINSNNGKFEAVWVKSLNGVRLVPMANILHWSQFGIMLDEESSLILPDNFPNADLLEKKDVPILGAKVFVNNKKGDYIGKVYNFVFDTLSPQLLAIHVRRNKFFPWLNKRIISRSKIKKITKDGIFVTTNFADLKDFVKNNKALLDKKKIPDFEDCKDCDK